MDEDYSGYRVLIEIEEPLSANQNMRFTENIDYVTMFGTDCDSESWLIDWLNEGQAMAINGQCTFIPYCRWRKHHKHNESYKEFLIKHAKRKDGKGSKDNR